MSLFRKHVDVPEPGPQPPAPVQPQAPQAPQPQQQGTTITGSTVDFRAVYQHAQLAADELERVARAQELLGALPGKATHTKAVVDATLKAFGVDAERIVAAAQKELRALEGFIRASHESSQRVIDQGTKRIAELEAEIERCRGVNATAAREQEERARTANGEMLRVQQVLSFFGKNSEEIDELDPGEPDEPTQVGGAKKRRVPMPAELK